MYTIVQRKKETIQQQPKYKELTRENTHRLYAKKKCGLGEVYEWHNELGDYDFVSIVDGRVGSIYFAKGRIRLLHRGGPEIKVRTQKLKRYAINEELKNLVKKSQDTSECPNKEKNTPSVVEAKHRGLKWKLYETYFAEGGYRVHLSRGSATPLCLNRKELEKLYSVVKSATGSIRKKNKYVYGELKELHSKLGWSKEYYNQVQRECKPEI